MRLKERDSGITIAHIRTWAFVCLAVGIAGVAVIQRGIMGIGKVQSTAEMAALLEQDEFQHFAVISLICMGIYACAVPLFGLMLVEGSLHTRDFSKYLLRVAAVALLSEVPFDYATKGVWLDLPLNPAFGLLAALVMLMFFRRYCDNSLGSIILRCIITVAVMAWTMFLLPIEEGPCIVLIVSVLWNLREKPVLRTIFGCVAGVACVFFSIFYVATPLAMIVVHFYNGEKGADFKWGRLAIYPGILLLTIVLYLLVF